MDVYGFCIIVDKVDTCYRVLGVLHNFTNPSLNALKTISPFPKPMAINHCIPLYLVLMVCLLKFKSAPKKCIRWQKMALRRIGYIKPRKTFYDAQSRAKEWLKGILEMDKSSRNSLEFIENVKIDLISDEVYVFTPKGQFIEFLRCDGCGFCLCHSLRYW